METETNNITKGNWVTSLSPYHSNIYSEPNGLIATIDHKGECKQEHEANAKAICNAVNNTYGSNINPSAVPELLEALKGVMEDLKSMACNYAKYNTNEYSPSFYGNIASISKAKEAISKATL